MKKYVLSLIPVLFIVFLYGCFKKLEPQPCNYDPCAYKAPATEIAAVKQFIDSIGITGTTQHCSGLFYKIETTGTGKTPEVCSYVNAKYKGKFINGNVFDSSNTGVDFSLAGVIPGWTNGVPLIKEGGKITLYVPPSLGYGSQNYGNIPGNSILIFDVELVKAY
jgi:FKBP-type peptidyl-prolyl cis-trans isomerase FkpA